MPRQYPSTDDLSNAANAWAADTSRVSQFLSAAPGLSGQDLADQAAAALASENDELTQKAVLDSMFVFVAYPDSSVQQANHVLVDQKRFQFAVDGLSDLANNGATFSTDQISEAINEINKDRCSKVLPAIDAYFQAASGVLQNGLTLVANRPDNCPAYSYPSSGSSSGSFEQPESESSPETSSS